MKIGIIVAMDKEFAQLKTLLSDSKTEHRNHKDFVTGTIGGIPWHPFRDADRPRR